ncbi:Chaperone for wingless signaling and trafficking of LDL receptor [Desmophyllum pertusum]|uniref:Chaperone for wingless signaling and trafficking of LDL receptor n=1 Tax=Desmophyllum pertusum TaxID=174260 RepID=A0A9X0DBY2_9CNID|nr:Chaperone for wingless signaling and trafficking of LDL receptor [Desmophyllum pertusum]
MAINSFSMLFWALFFIILLQDSLSWQREEARSKTKKEKSNKIGKDVMDYSEADLHKLLDQWEDNDNDIDEEDRYDDHDPRKPVPSGGGFDPQEFKGDPIALLKQSKKGKVVMLFVSVAGTPSRAGQYMVADDRVLFMVKDGSLAWDVKDFWSTPVRLQIS